MTISPISKRSLDQLETELVSLAQQINQHEYQFLVMVREFDIRQGWKAYHFNNCAEWLNMKCGISLGTAREKVRVSRDLFDLPLCSEKFENGELSYSKVRAMTRAANGYNEVALVDHALLANAHQVEEHCRQLRNADRRRSTPDARRAFKERSLLRTCHPNGTMSINVELPQELGDLVMKALEIAMPDGGNQAGVTGATQDAFFAKQADALVELARAYLSGDLSGDASGRLSNSDNHQVVVHVDAAALRDEGGKSDLPVESIRRIACDSDLVEVTEDAKGNLLNLGRKHRVVSPQQKRALLARDKHCTYPGCSHEKFLSAHHVKHWADGGETSLDNLILLCSSHHTLLHEGGFSIHKNFAGDWYFRNADGGVLPDASVYQPVDYDASRDAFVDDPVVAEAGAVYAVG